MRCSILSKYDGLASDLEKYDYYSRENNLKNPLKEAIKQKLPDEIIDYYRKFKSRVNLHNMTNFKSIMFSNGNKSLYDIIDVAAKTILIKEDNITIEIDQKFKKYHIANMQNGELFSVVLNHFKSL